MAKPEFYVPEYITVGDLIAELKTIDPKRIVVMSRDPEGNDYAPMYSCWEGAYKDGEVGLEKLTAEHKKRGYTKEDVCKGTPAMILVPM